MPAPHPCTVPSTPARRVDLVHPAGVERRARDGTESRRAREEALAERDHLGEVHAQPADAAVVDARELRLEPFAERDDRPVAVRAREPDDRLVDAAGAKRLPGGRQALPVLAHGRERRRRCATMPIESFPSIA